MERWEIDPKEYQSKPGTVEVWAKHTSEDNTLHIGRLPTSASALDFANLIVQTMEEAVDESGTSEGGMWFFNVLVWPEGEDEPRGFFTTMRKGFKPTDLERYARMGIVPEEEEGPDAIQ
jgi:hypothetical protein